MRSEGVVAAVQPFLTKLGYLAVDFLSMLRFQSLLENDLRRSISVFADRKGLPEKPFAFALNVARLVGADSIEVGPGYTLRRANPCEIDFIKKSLRDLFGQTFGISPWERRTPRRGTKLIDLPKSQWRYHVIEFAMEEPNLEVLETAGTIANVELDIGLIRIDIDIRGGAVRPGSMYHPRSLFQSLSVLNGSLNPWDEMRPVSSADGKDTFNLFSLIEAHDPSIFDLDKVVKLLRELKDLPQFSFLQVLGYFAILEAILTHQPDPEDKYESITNQIIRKLALLNNRWRPALDYSPFKGAKQEKIWKSMYGYRSSIAHGRKPDFKTPQLSVLQNADSANELIKEAVKKSLRQAYTEPQLIADLQNV
jgi:hypothetical protein